MSVKGVVDDHQLSDTQSEHSEQPEPAQRPPLRDGLFYTKDGKVKDKNKHIMTQCIRCTKYLQKRCFPGGELDLPCKTCQIEIKHNNKADFNSKVGDGVKMHLVAQPCATNSKT